LRFTFFLQAFEMRSCHVAYLITGNISFHAPNATLCA
jgi:hypothetical protein